MCIYTYIYPPGRREDLCPQREAGPLGDPALAPDRKRETERDR